MLMATPLTDIYDFFLSKVTDYNFLQLNASGDLESVLFKYLRSAVTNFNNCTKDLTIDEVNQEFIEDLDTMEKEILATLMVVQYLNQKIVNVKNMEQVLSDKEYKMYSQSNHLREMLSLKKELQSDVSHLMNTYSFKNGLRELM
jgi:esterase/lipase